MGDEIQLPGEPAAPTIQMWKHRGLGGRAPHDTIGLGILRDRLRGNRHVNSALYGAGLSQVITSRTAVMARLGPHVVVGLRIVEQGCYPLF